MVNYEDPNLNISIPVFSIHGNHDDPAGVRISSILKYSWRKTSTKLCSDLGLIEKDKVLFLVEVTSYRVTVRVIVS